jgi:hypothetical protein
MGRFSTLTAFAGAALLSHAALAAQDYGIAAYTDNDALSIKVAIDDADGPARDDLQIAAYRNDDPNEIDFSAGAYQDDTQTKLTLAFPAESYLGADMLFIDVYEPGGFRLYEIFVRVGDLRVFRKDINDDTAANITGPGQIVPVGNPYGDDVLYPGIGAGRPSFADDDAFDFGDGSTPATAATAPPARRPKNNNGAGSIDGGGHTDSGPGTPYGDDTVIPDSPLSDANSNPANDFGDGSGGNPFAPGDGDLGAGGNPDDYTLQAGPEEKGLDTLIEPSLALDFSDTAQGPQLYRPRHDCNDNGTFDHLEILADAGLDTDGDGLLDRCTASGDLDASGTVDAGDLVLLMANWGNCYADTPCQADLNADGLIDGGDVSFLFAHWTY